MQHPADQQDQRFFGHPKPLKGLFFTELWERFSFYGIRPILILYMAAMVIDGGLGLNRADSAAIVGIFAGSMYLLTILGGWIADNWLGQARSVWYGSIIIALGHLSIALNAFLDSFFFYFGLILIAAGTGLFKTCISVIVGTLYAAQDSRRDAGFSIFYMGINIGAFLAPLITGLLIQDNGWHWGFAIGGVGMLVALLIFRFIATPQLLENSAKYGTDQSWNTVVAYNPRAPKIVAVIVAIAAVMITLVSMGVIQIEPVLFATYLTVIICLCMVGYFGYLLFFASLKRKEQYQIVVCFILLLAAALFWSAFEQKPTSFNLFAHDYTNRQFFGFEIPTLWFQSVNALFIITCAPLAAWLWVKLGRANKDPSYIVKFVIALLLAGAGFVMMAMASQSVIEHGQLVSPLWIISSMLLLTLGELCLSPVGLSAMTKLAPAIIRGQVMGLWFTASALGNLMAGLIASKATTLAIVDLPNLFMKCTISLVIGAILLFLLRGPIKKLMATEPSPSPSQEA